MNAQDVFSDLIWDWVSLRFTSLSYGVNQDREKDDPLPFMLSAAFLRRFERVLRQVVIPDVVARSNGLLNAAEKEPEDQRKVFLRNYFNDRQGRVVMWETWQAAWKATMTEQQLPTKPQAPAPKRGLKSLLKKKAPPQSGRTEEQWAAKAKQINKSNQITQKVWTYLQDDTKSYIPPNTSDSQLLMEFFGRSVKLIKDQKTAIRQIVKQEGNAAKTFDLYQKGKPINMTLLAVCYYEAELMLGEKAVLKDIMRGQRASDFPLIARFLPGYIKGA